MRMATVLAALVAATASPLSAGFSCPLYFDEPHVTIQATQAQGGIFVPMDSLPIKGLAVLLEQYVAARIDRGELPSTVHFEILGTTGYWAWLAPVPTCLTRSQSSYSIYTEDLSLRNLVRLVEFSASERWRSFCYDRGDPSKTPGLIPRLEQTLERILDEAVGEPDLSFFAGRRAVVYRVGELAVIYQDGRLFYELAGKELGVPPEGFLPVQVGDRYILQSRHAAVVFEAGAVIARHPLPGGEEEVECDSTYSRLARAYPKWANVTCGPKAVLSYSAERNRFYRVRVVHPDDCFDPSRALGVRWGECG